jgi:hypothetical protein
MMALRIIYLVVPAKAGDPYAVPYRFGAVAETFVHQIRR